MTDWIDYLRAAYPAAKPTDQTIAVLESRFQNERPGRMMRVAIEHVQASKWFPAVSELVAIVARLAADDELKQAAPWAAIARREKERREREAWAVCDRCGEYTPSLDNCPFCADMEQIVLELEETAVP